MPPPSEKSPGGSPGDFASFHDTGNKKMDALSFLRIASVKGSLGMSGENGCGCGGQILGLIGGHVVRRRPASGSSRCRAGPSGFNQRAPDPAMDDRNSAQPRRPQIAGLKVHAGRRTWGLIRSNLATAPRFREVRAGKAGGTRRRAVFLPWVFSTDAPTKEPASGFIINWRRPSSAPAPRPTYPGPCKAFFSSPGQRAQRHADRGRTASESSVDEGL